MMEQKQESIQELMLELAKAREIEDELGVRADLMYDRMVATQAGTDWTEANAAHNAKRKEVEALDTKIREAIIENFNETGDKKPATGAGIRIVKGRIKISNTDAALWWAKKHMPVAVIETADEKRLVAEAGFRLKADGELPVWATKTKDRVTATVSKDLSSYLPE